MPVVVSNEPALTIGRRTWSHEELGHAALHGAHMHGLDASARVLSVLPLDKVDGIDAGLLIPLAAGASVVLVTQTDATKLATTIATEKVTHTAGVEAPGVIRLDNE
jgi:non-ribosomal peptide synthetase component E (peptide arylation enzyme)